MNKKGFIKTVEAIIAILLIFIFVYYITPKTTDTKEVGEVKELQTEILKGISESEEYRECIINNQNLMWIQGANGIDSDFPNNINGFTSEKCTQNAVQTKIKIFVESALPPKFQKNYRLVICEEGRCGLPPEKDTVYTSAIIITSSVKSQNYNPKIARLYFW